MPDGNDPAGIEIGAGGRVIDGPAEAPGPETQGARLGRARRRHRMIVAAVPLALFIVIAIASGAGWPWVVVAVIAAIAVWSLWLIGRQARAIGYAERDEELLVRTGIAWRRIVVVPYGRLQYVDVLAGPLDRALGIARVQLHTASAASDAGISPACSRRGWPSSL